MREPGSPCGWSAPLCGSRSPVPAGCPSERCLRGRGHRRPGRDRPPDRAGPASVRREGAPPRGPGCRPGPRRVRPGNHRPQGGAPGRCRRPRAPPTRRVRRLLPVLRPVGPVLGHAPWWRAHRALLPPHPPGPRPGRRSRRRPGSGPGGPLHPPPRGRRRWGGVRAASGVVPCEPPGRRPSRVRP